MADDFVNAAKRLHESLAHLLRDAVDLVRGRDQCDHGQTGLPQYKQP
jgi:hypothetical protein